MIVKFDTRHNAVPSIDIIIPNNDTGDVAYRISHDGEGLTIHCHSHDRIHIDIETSDVVVLYARNTTPGKSNASGKLWMESIRDTSL